MIKILVVVICLEIVYIYMVELWINIKSKFNINWRSFIYDYFYCVGLASLLLLLAMVGTMGLTIDTESRLLIFEEKVEMVKRCDIKFWNYYYIENSKKKLCEKVLI